MFKNYLIVAVRNLLRQKLYAAITIFGLSLGLAGCLLIGIFLVHEWSHDQFHEHADEIYRVLVNHYDRQGNSRWSALHPFTMMENFKKSVPGIAGACGYMRSHTDLFHDKEKKFFESVGLVSPGFLDMFSFPLLAGNPKDVLKEPHSAVITETLAKKLFGEIQPDYANIIGKTLSFGLYGQKLVANITGILKDVPTTSSLDFSVLIPIENHRAFPVIHGMNNAFTSLYVRIQDRQAVPALETAIASYAQNYIKNYEGAQSGEKPDKNQNFQKFRLQPLTEIYLNPPGDMGYAAVGNPTGMTVLAIIGILVLVIACGNFITISTGRSMGRNLEVGMRKVLGAGRRQLMLQFWGEAMLLSIISMAFGLVLAKAALPAFNNLIQKSLQISLIGSGSTILLIIGLTVAVGLAAGIYPALIQSRFRPTRSLKGPDTGIGRNTLTRALVMAQYAISILLLISTLVIVTQHRYMSSKDLGYDKENVVVVEVIGDWKEDPKVVANRYKTAVSSYNKVINATITDRNFTSGSSLSLTGYKMPDGSYETIWLLQIDPDYLSTLKIPLLAGRNLSYDYPSDTSSAVLVNEELVKTLDLKEPVGHILNGFHGQSKPPAIVGVVKDFHIDNLHRPIAPLVMQMEWAHVGSSVLIRIRPGDIRGTIGWLRETWERVVPNLVFRQSFLDGNLDRQYREEERWRNIVGYGALFAILISSMGLFGLVALSAARRTKEIGIRKVLGASVSNIMVMMSREFAMLLVISNVIAWPIAWYAMNRWLQNFAYRIEIGIYHFIFAGLIALLIALATVSFQTFKAARANPTEALRYE